MHAFNWLLFVLFQISAVQIKEVTPSLVLGSPLIENARARNTWINIELETSGHSASIIGSNLWKASCFANSEENGSGIRYSLQNAILQQSELDKDLLYSMYDLCKNT